MNKRSAVSLERAGDFIWRNARLIERALFAHLFVEASARAVIAALMAYQNADRGFGNALEADVRAPSSMLVAARPRRSCFIKPPFATHRSRPRYAITWRPLQKADGRVPIVTNEIFDYPRAFHWSASLFGGDSPNPTAVLVGLLQYQEVRHQWLSRAADWCWRRLENPLHATYEITTALRFLQHAPNRQRAREIALRIAREAEKTSLFQIHPDRSRYGLTPLHLCPTPDSIAAEAFGENVFIEHLDELAALQQADGGSPITWEAPGPGAEIEWRGRITLDAFITLRAYGRI